MLHALLHGVFRFIRGLFVWRGFFRGIREQKLGRDLGEGQIGLAATPFAVQHGELHPKKMKIGGSSLVLNPKNFVPIFTADNYSQLAHNHFIAEFQTLLTEKEQAEMP